MKNFYAKHLTEKAILKAKCYLQTQMKNFFFILYINHSIKNKNVETQLAICYPVS